MAGEGRQRVLEGEEKPGNHHQVGPLYLIQGAVDLNTLTAHGGDFTAPQIGRQPLEYRRLSAGKTVSRMQHLHGDGRACGRTLVSEQ